MTEPQMGQRVTGEKLVVFFTAVAVAAVALGIAYWQVDPKGGFWQWPGILAVALLGVGLVGATIGLLRRDQDVPQQRQRAGKHSEQHQAGRDLNINNRD